MQKMPTAQLVNTFDGEVHPIREKKCMIGRQSGENGITVNEGIVSREHAVIQFEDNHYLLQDSGSKNGTFLNGQRLEPGDRRRLQHEDIIEFSKLKYVFRILPQEESRILVKGLEGKIEISGGQKKLVITIPKEKMVSYQQKMCENNKIKGILDAACLDAGDRVLLYYGIDGLRKFESVILKQENEEKEILKILLQVTETIRGLARYLLPEDNLTLEPDMVFIDETGLVKLIYLPIAEKQEGYGIRETLLGLILFAVPQSAKNLGLLEEEKRSPVQMSRILADRLERIRREEACLSNETEPAVTSPRQSMVGFFGKRRQEHQSIPIDGLKKELGGQDKAHVKRNVLKPMRILLFQIPILLLIGLIYALQVLKPVDFLGFCIITAALDTWIIKTLQKPKGEAL